MNFAALTQTDKPVLVDFHADWCAPCRAMRPVLDDVTAYLGDQAVVLKIDVDRHQELARQYGILSIPTFIVFQNGKPLWRKTGMTSSYELVEVIRKIISLEPVHS